jgi:hypothetical protein
LAECLQAGEYAGQDGLMTEASAHPAHRTCSGSLLSLWSTDSILSIGSVGSVLSIGSIGSTLSVGSIGSALSLISAGSWLSKGSVLSAQSQWSVLSWRSSRAFRSAGALGAVTVTALLLAGRTSRRTPDARG